jgi:hypothetical protein
MPPAVRLILPLLVLLLAALAWLKPLDQLAETHAEAGLKRAVASFAAARALNAVISVVQGTELTGGVVVGVKLAPGQVLDPVNDLIEQFSTLMLAASIAFGTQLLLMQIGAGWLVAGALTLVALVWGGCYLRGPPPAWLSRVLLALLLVRFIVPVAALASEYAFQAFMADQYQVHQQGIEQAAESFGALPVAEEAAKARWWEVRERIDELKASAERIVDHTIRIAVVFLLQTLVLPFLVMWGMLQAVRLLSSPTGARSQGPEGCQHGQLVSMPGADYGVAPRGDGKQ